MNRLRFIHRLLAVGIAVAVPAIAFTADGTIAIEIFVLGAASGFAYWYWGPTGTLL